MIALPITLVFLLMAKVGSIVNDTVNLVLSLAFLSRNIQALSNSTPKDAQRKSTGSGMLSFAQSSKDALRGTLKVLAKMAEASSERRGRLSDVLQECKMRP